MLVGLAEHFLTGQFMEKPLRNGISQLKSHQQPQGEDPTEAATDRVAQMPCDQGWSSSPCYLPTIVALSHHQSWDHCLQPLGSLAVGHFQEGPMHPGCWTPLRSLLRPQFLCRAFLRHLARPHACDGCEAPCGEVINGCL